MSLQALITRFVDLFYVWPATVFVSRQTFRYAVCGATTLGLDIVWYALFYNFVFDRTNLDLGLVVVSPHIAALILVFPITFFTGFWLNRHVAFSTSSLSTYTQLGRYVFQVAGALVLNYVCVKFFVEVCGIWPTPSKILVNIISVIFSYLTARFFTFRDVLE